MKKRIHWQHVHDMTCDCGAQYRIEKMAVPMRDKDSENCAKCGAELVSWNGGVMYRATPIDRTSSAK